MTNNNIIQELSRYRVGTFAHIIHRNAIFSPHREAYIYGDRRITFSEYNTRVNRLVNALYRMGLKKGDVIGILSWGCLPYAEFYGAAMKGGFVASPYNPRLKSDELDYLINYSGTNIIFVGPELVDLVHSLKARIPDVKTFVCLEGNADGMKGYEDLLAANSGEEPDVDMQEDDPVCIIYTSGTTGVPRGALYTHRRFMEDTRSLAIAIGLKPEYRRIQISPLFHIAGNTHFRGFMYIGGTTVIVKFFDAEETLRIIQDEKITHVDMVPTHLSAMLAVPHREKYDTSTLKMMWYGGSPMPIEVLRKGMEAFGPIFAQAYGQSESGPMICFLSQAEHNVLDRSAEEQKILTSAGRPDIGVQVKIVDDKDNALGPNEIGEITVKSKHVMVEYFKKPEDTKAALLNGWLHTGDIGYCDNNGYVYLVDRKKDMIISGGENVYSREVEDILYQHPAIREAAVFGIPDSYWVEKVHAVVSLEKDKSATAEEITAFCKKKLAGYKVPKSIDFLDELPKNAAGKILKKELKQKYRRDSDSK